jgi:drug/metabolite transporter (DMT)-like permease
MIPILIVFSGFLAAVSQILLKKSASKPHSNRIREYLNSYVILGYGGYVCVLALNIFLFTRMQFRYGVLSNSLAIVFVMVLSRFVLQEEVTRKKILGAALIIAGVVCFAFF